MNKKTLEKAKALHEKLGKVYRIVNLHSVPKNPTTKIEPSKRGEQKKHIGLIEFTLPVTIKPEKTKPEEAHIAIRIEENSDGSFEISANAYFMDRTSIKLYPGEDEKLIDAIATLGRVFRNAIMDELDRWKRSVQKEFDELQIIDEEEE